MRRRGDLSGWILMIVLIVAAMSLIFYILLLRAQHLSSMEQQRENPQPESMIEQPATASAPVVLHATEPGALPVPHFLVIPQAGLPL